MNPLPLAGEGRVRAASRIHRAGAASGPSKPSPQPSPVNGRGNFDGERRTVMARYTETDPAALDPAQRRIWDEIAAGPRGGVPAPLQIWLKSPELAARAQHLGAFALRHLAAAAPFRARHSLHRALLDVAIRM